MSDIEYMQREINRLRAALVRDHALLCELRKNLAPGRFYDATYEIVQAIEQGSRALNKINE